MANDRDVALTAAEQVDSLIDRALDELEEGFGGYPLFGVHPLRQMRVVALAEAYLDGGAFPADRVGGLVSRAIDVKIQLYLVGNIVPGMVNHHYYDRVNRDTAAADRASVQLMVLSLHQDMIAKSRILWDRILGLVYFIETGVEDLPRTRSRSAKRAFFEMCERTPRWKWMGAYASVLSDYDDRFRTPELHKRSALRAILMRGHDLTELSNEVLALVNHAMNTIWPNIASIVGGGGVIALGSAHLEMDSEGNPTGDAFDRWGWHPSDGSEAEG